MSKAHHDALTSSMAAYMAKHPDATVSGSMWGWAFTAGVAAQADATSVELALEVLRTAVYQLGDQPPLFDLARPALEVLEEALSGESEEAQREP